MTKLDFYISAFARLNTDKGNRWHENFATRHQAPHKPILLLSVIDKFALDLMSANLIELDFELCELFQSFWSRVMSPERRGNIAMPFFHMQKEGFWEMKWRSGKAPHGKIHSVSKLVELSFGAKLDEDLFSLLGSDSNRRVLRQVLVDNYFADDAGRLILEQSEINRGAYAYSYELIQRARMRIKEAPAVPGTEDNRETRNQGFRKAVRLAYNYTCAMTGIRVITDDGHVGVQGAHIVPWKDGQDDSLRNGIALSPTCHWAFDEGLLTITDAYTIQLSPQLRRGHNAPMYLAELEGVQLNLPEDESFWPDSANLQRHRREVFRRR